jgi:hypothetical protein
LKKFQNWLQKLTFLVKLNKEGIMANLGGELFGDMLKVASGVTKKAHGIPVDDSGVPHAKVSKLASKKKTATDWNQVREWMQNNARDFDNATMLAESTADNFGLYEGDEADIPTEVFDLAHEVMYENNFAVAHTDGEFSDIGGVPKLEVTSAETKTAEPAAAPALAPAPQMPLVSGFEVGDEVRAKLGPGQFMRGEIESIKGQDAVVVNEKGLKKTVPLGSLESMEEVDQAVKNNKNDLRVQQQKEEEDAANFKGPGAQPVSGADATQLAAALEREGYKLYVKAKDSANLEKAYEEYLEWTGGEDLPEAAAKEYPSMRSREWTVEFMYSPDLPIFFPIAPMGTNNNRPYPVPTGLSYPNGKVVMQYPEVVAELVKAGLRAQVGRSAHASLLNKKMHEAHIAKLSHHSPEEAELPASLEVNGDSTGAKQLPPVETKVPEAEKEAGFNFFFPGQVVKEFYPELQHEVVDYPNDTNDPMIEDFDIAASLETPKLSYVSTSPAAAVGIGRDGKPQVLDGAPLRKENDIRGGMFMDEFHQQYEGVPGALLAVASKVAAKDEQHQFEVFLKKVMAEIAAAFIAAFKVTGRPILNMVPGIGEVQLAQVEQPSSLSSFNIVNTGSRVKYLLDKLNDGDVKDAINKARAQAAVWVDDPNGGFVYEVFTRAESIDTDSMIMKYTFIIGTKETE